MTHVIWWSHPREGGNVDGPSPDLLAPVVNRTPAFNKPTGGLWTSPEDTEWGWEDWCRQEQPDWLGTRWRLEIVGEPRILRIASPADLLATFERYPHLDRWTARDGTEYVDRGVDWEAVGRDYDAVWLTADGHFSTRLARVADLSIGTYSWDCETVLWYRWHFGRVEHERRLAEVRA